MSRALHVLTLAAVLLGGCDRALIVRRDAGVDAGMDAGPPPRITARLPPRPDIDDTPGGAERIYVLRDPVLDQTADRWRSIGWDLDGRCTALPMGMDAGTPVVGDGGPSDAGASDAGADAGIYADWDIECLPRNPMTDPVADGVECRDNTFGAGLSPGLAAIGIDVEAAVRARMEQGEFAVLLRLREYDGEPNDARVVADVFPTVYAIPEGGRRRDAPRWDGTDAFFVADNSFAPMPADQAVIHDELAYVAEGRLVVHLPTRAEFLLASTGAVLRLRITDATITGRIAADPALPLEDALIAGRWPLTDLLTELPALGVCETSPYRPLVETAVNSAADVLGEPRTGSGPLVPCEAISLGVAMRGYPGLWGGAAAFERPMEACP